MTYRTHGQTDYGTNIAAASDVQVSRHECSEISSRGDGIGRDVGSQLCKGESSSDDKDAESLTRAGTVKELSEKVKRIPGISIIENDR